MHLMKKKYIKGERSPDGSQLEADTCSSHTSSGTVSSCNDEIPVFVDHFCHYFKR